MTKIILIILIFSSLHMHKLHSQIKSSDDFLRKIKLPKGYVVDIFAKDIGGPAMMAEDSEGNIYVSRPKTNDILILKDADHLGVVSSTQVFLAGLDRPYGLAIENNNLYISTPKEIYNIDLKNKNKNKIVLDHLSNQNKDHAPFLAIGLDHKLYYGRIFGWHPVTKKIYEMDQDAVDFKFYNGSMFPKTKGLAFVAFHGPRNGKKARGYNVSKIIFKNGKPLKYITFMTGFLTIRNQLRPGQPAGLLVLKDGSLLVSDDSRGVIYRVYYDNTP